MQSAGASNAMTAFGGETGQGPLDHAVQVKSMAEFVGIYGVFWNECPLRYSIQSIPRNSSSSRNGNSSGIPRLIRPQSQRVRDLGTCGTSWFVGLERRPAINGWVGGDGRSASPSTDQHLPRDTNRARRTRHTQLTRPSPSQWLCHKLLPLQGR